MKRTGIANLAETATKMADANPQAALVYAILDLAQAVRENGNELQDLVRHHEMIGKELGSVSEAIADVSRELTS